MSPTNQDMLANHEHSTSRLNMTLQLLKNATKFKPSMRKVDLNDHTLTEELRICELNFDITNQI